jgi:uncharacterized Fe-S cluster protein YjdI
MPRKSSIGRDVTVSFDPDLCQHVGNCLRGLPAVFAVDRQPWINPDGAEANAVIAQVARCLQEHYGSSGDSQSDMWRSVRHRERPVR